MEGVKLVDSINDKSIALFIDNENLRKCQNGDFNSCDICDHLSEKYGKIVLGKSYWAFGKRNSLKNFPGSKAYNLFLRGIEIVPVPTFADGSGFEKNIADGKLIVDTLFYLERYQHIEIWVIATNDKDMIPLLEELKRRGKEVILIHSQDVEILNTICERLGIIRILYQDIVSHRAM